MPRYKITIEYDGTDYAGWQQQKDAPSIQEELQKAAFKFLAEDVVITGAGRTDAGVHALGQVAHFDTVKTLEPFKLCQAFNAHLRPQPISVLNAEIVPDDFHARFNAKKRFYVYKILNRRSRPALYVNRMWWVHQPLNVEKMQDAAQVLIGFAPRPAKPNHRSKRWTKSESNVTASLFSFISVRGLFCTIRSATLSAR